MKIPLWWHIDEYYILYISPFPREVRDHFAHGLKNFSKEYKDEYLVAFDRDWAIYEEHCLKAVHTILEEVFTPIEQLVSLEEALSNAEREEDEAEVSKNEQALANAMEGFYNVLFPSTDESKFPEDVIQLAEMTVFYHTKCEPEWVEQANAVIRDFLTARAFIAKIPVYIYIYIGIG